MNIEMYNGIQSALDKRPDGGKVLKIILDRPKPLFIINVDLGKHDFEDKGWRRLEYQTHTVAWRIFYE